MFVNAWRTVDIMADDIWADHRRRLNGPVIVWTAPPPRPDPDRKAALAEGDRLRAQNQAWGLCWLPSDPEPDAAVRSGNRKAKIADRH